MRWQEIVGYGILAGLVIYTLFKVAQFLTVLLANAPTI